MANITVRKPATKSGASVQRKFIASLSLSLLLSPLMVMTQTSMVQAEGASDTTSDTTSDTKGSATSDSAPTTRPVPPGAEKVELLSDRPPVLRWSPVGKAKGVVLCLHELGMNMSVFADLGKRVSSSGYIVYAMDERGFGAWEQMKGREARMNLDRILLDIKDSVTELHKKETGLPVFLLGEAMGGALALKAAVEYPDLIQGTISSAPGGEHFNTSHNYLKVGSKFLAGPNKRFPMGKELIAAATPNAETQDYLENEAKVRLNLSPKELMACQFFMYKTNDFARQIKKVPVMIVQGQRDGETKPESSDRIYQNLATGDKKMLPIANGDHYVYEGKRVDDKAMQETLAWLDNHLTNPIAKP